MQQSSSSPFQSYRQSYIPPLAPKLQNIGRLKAIEGAESHPVEGEVLKAFPNLAGLKSLEFDYSGPESQSLPLRVGVLFSGGQASGGNNVIAGLYDALKEMNQASEVIGFVGGPAGLIAGTAKVIEGKELRQHRNLGGFDLLGSDRTKLSASKHQRVLESVEKYNLDALVIIGGDDSNTNAAFLSEYFISKGCKTCVVGVPKTIDGDLKSKDIEVSFGFDTAAKTYAEMIASLARDAISAGKYYFFVKLMGRTASHIALECALQTHPNYTLIGEEVAFEGLSLRDIVLNLTDLIVQRSASSRDYGVILVPEGLLEFIPDCKLLLKELAALSSDISLENVLDQLSSEAKACYQALPSLIQRQLLLDRDSHGNLQVSKIETERLLIEMITEELQKRKRDGSYSGQFKAQPFFCGYEGRSCTPSNFDANYCYSLGYVAAALAHNRKNGYMACVRNLSQAVEAWEPMAISLISLLGIEERKGKREIVISKALVDLEGAPFKSFKKNRIAWALNDDYRFPGPIQWYGPSDLTEGITCTLELEGARNDL